MTLTGITEENLRKMEKNKSGLRARLRRLIGIKHLGIMEARLDEGLRFAVFELEPPTAECSSWILRIRIRAGEQSGRILWGCPREIYYNVHDNSHHTQAWVGQSWSLVALTAFDDGEVDSDLDLEPTPI